MPTCPNGHRSTADDWCEVCGHRMPSDTGPIPPPGQPAPGGYGYPPAPPVGYP
ncbi:forkhead-associated protein, partial [Streptomyces sp. IF17]|nr:forkhead-associated protein [Streptomyces alkaliphilus]